MPTKENLVVIDCPAIWPIPRKVAPREVIFLKHAHAHQKQRFKGRLSSVFYHNIIHNTFAFIDLGVIFESIT